MWLSSLHIKCKIWFLNIKNKFYWPYIVNINHLCAALGIQNLRSSEVTYIVMVLLISPFAHSLFIIAWSSFDSQLFSHSWLLWLIGAWTNSLKYFKFVFEIGQWVGFKISFPNIQIKEQGYIYLIYALSLVL